MQREEELLKAFVDSRNVVLSLDAQLKEKKEQMNKAEQALITYMEDNNISSTAKYEQYGRLSLIAPALRVSIVDGRDDEAFQYLRSIGESEAIRQTIHYKTLSSIMKQKVESNNPVPDCFSWFFQSQTRYEQPK